MAIAAILIYFTVYRRDFYLGLGIVLLAAVEISARYFKTRRAIAAATLCVIIICCFPFLYLAFIMAAESFGYPAGDFISMP